jgi:hypothetical protein
MHESLIVAWTIIVCSLAGGACSGPTTASSVCNQNDDCAHGEVCVDGGCTEADADNDGYDGTIDCDDLDGAVATTCSLFGDGRDGDLEVTEPYDITRNGGVVKFVEDSSDEVLLRVDNVDQLAVGDLVLIIDLQGEAAGGWEVATIAEVLDANTIRLASALARSYPVLDRVYLQRIPQYSSVSIRAGGSITAAGWRPRSTDGVERGSGVVTFAVQGVLEIDEAGSVAANAIGFRGGSAEQHPEDHTGWVRTTGGRRHAAGAGGAGGCLYVPGGNCAEDGNAGDTANSGLRNATPVDDTSQVFLGGGGSQGGSGGRGGNRGAGPAGGAARPGGGIVLIWARQAVLNGTIVALGGAGGHGGKGGDGGQAACGGFIPNVTCGGGGGGGGKGGQGSAGGSIQLVVAHLAFPETAVHMSAAGGPGGAGGAGGADGPQVDGLFKSRPGQGLAGSAGPSGSPGAVRVQAALVNEAPITDQASLLDLAAVVGGGAYGFLELLP